MAERAGVDGISLVVGWHESNRGALGRDVPSDGWLRLAQAAKQAVSVPIAFGPRFGDPRMAEEGAGAGRLRLLGGLPADAGRPAAGAQAGPRRGGRGPSLHRRAGLPVADVPQPALHLHDEPAPGPRVRAGDGRAARRATAPRAGDRRRAGRDGGRARRRPPRPRGGVVGTADHAWAVSCWPLPGRSAGERSFCG